MKSFCCKFWEMLAGLAEGTSEGTRCLNVFQTTVILIYVHIRTGCVHKSKDSPTD